MAEGSSRLPSGSSSKLQRRGFQIGEPYEPYEGKFYSDIQEGLDPDDPSVNIERHIASMDIDQIMARLGFSERKPTWNRALKGRKLREDAELPPEDDPAKALEYFAQHTEQVEKDALESAINMAVQEFETRVRLRGIDNAKDADQLAAEVGSQYAEMAGYRNGSDEFDWVVSAVNNACGEMFPGQWEDYEPPVQEAVDPDDPEAYVHSMETDWRKILKQYGWQHPPHEPHLSYTLEFPDRVWGPNWPMRIYAGHGWGPEADPDLDAEDAAFEQWRENHPMGGRDVNFPDYVYFQFGREHYRRIEVPLARLALFCSRLVRDAKKVLGTEHIDHDHPETADLTTMLWNVGKQIARDLKIPVNESQ